MIAPFTLRLNPDEPTWSELCQKYWELNDLGTFRLNTTSLARDYGLRKNELLIAVARGGTAVSTSLLCSTCERPYEYDNRSDYLQRQRSPRTWVCATCQKEAEAARVAAQQKADEAYRQIIVARYGAAERPPVDVGEMSLDSAVYLLSFVRMYAAEDFSIAHAVDPVGEDLLAPTTELTWDVVLHLFHAKLIFIHPQSPVSAFTGAKAETFYPLRVLWNLPTGMRSDDPRDLVEDLENALRATDWPDPWVSGRLTLWRTIALHECLQYLAVVLKEHGFEFNPGEKTRLVVSQLLQSFSVAQIYAMMWRAAKDAAAFMVRTRVPRQHAANTVVANIQKQGERALAEGWEVSAYKRHYSCPQSMISRVYFNVALKIGDAGFSSTPGFIEAI